ncbi:glycosyltransferase, GT2 family [Terrimicrobium sacchariphilum]|uniref:Glycosyltransferase, GT2 family n=1 Tax=Terrimicrobium sacchariphilum TaxID=690879 RepID=A0A146G4N7_TERSA|nr:glycosyltransferase [Terrimicrobium sacchariphilum]GAT31746.1 glycosyltransferase, GT2 family [Terrimicrobium sacchariphilum]
MGAMTQGVVAVVVTYRRLPELRRLLDCLGRSTIPLLGCVISDHSPDGSVAKLANEARGLEIVVREDPSNPGPGAGWSNAAAKAIEHFGNEVSALWYLDDDVVPASDCLEILLRDIKGAAAIAPLLSDTEGALWAFPEPEEPDLRRMIRKAATPAEARLLIGDAPHPACWATGACLLVTRRAYERTGGHRSDFWLLGEDLEYSMRLASEGGLAFTCRTAVPHLPIPSDDTEAARRGGYVKFCSLLQNLSYLSFHSSHSRHMRSYLPGNYRRFFRTYGWGWTQIADATRCLLGGIVQGQPAGGSIGQRLRREIGNRHG